MMYFDFNAGNKAYRLRLNTRNIISLEKQLGCNPVAIFGDGSQMPTISQMVTILWASLQQYQHNISLNDAYDIFDAWIEEGNTMTDFITVIIEIYKVSGIIKTENKVESEKN